MNAHPAGWFPDPEDPTMWRYWDGGQWTSQRSPRGQAALPARPSAHPAPAAGEPTGKWYFVIVLASVGLLAAVPFFHAASRLHRPTLAKAGAGYAAAGLLSLLLIGTAPVDATGDPTGFLSGVGVSVSIVSMLTASLWLIGVRRQVYDRVHILAPSRNQGAQATVSEARRRREEARRIAGADPMMARELGIGRPSLNRYDDGGLLDLNLATEQELASVAGLTPGVARSVIEAREAIGRFLSVDDAVVFGQVSEDETDLLRERGIVIG